jgi:hypothetical protein
MAKVKNIKTEWGNWKLKADSMKLAFEQDGEFMYEILIEGFCDSSAILNHIYQVNRNSWSTAKVMRNLLNAIDDIFFPQVNVCFNRENGKIDPKELVTAYLQKGPNKIEKLYNLLNKN